MAVAHGEALPLWRQVHCVSRDPGLLWNKDSSLGLDAPPDDHDPARAGEAAFAKAAPGPRTGVWRTHTPSVVRLDDGSYRMYYTESGPGLLWTQSRGRILSAVSADGALWSPEPGVRLGPHAGGAEMQVTSLAHSNALKHARTLCHAHMHTHTHARTRTHTLWTCRLPAPSLCLRSPPAVCGATASISRPSQAKWLQTVVETRSVRRRAARRYTARSQRMVPPHPTTP
eukprot:COSAG03_NODE_5309_length_1279_cov_1.447458_1_plen_228_part_00